MPGQTDLVEISCPLQHRKVRTRLHENGLRRACRDGLRSSRFSGAYTTVRRRRPLPAWAVPDVRGSVVKTMQGTITIVQESRFQLTDDGGVSHLFILGHDTLAEPDQLEP